jgi:hypothetical protein
LRPVRVVRCRVPRGCRLVPAANVEKSTKDRSVSACFSTWAYVRSVNAGSEWPSFSLTQRMFLPDSQEENRNGLGSEHNPDRMFDPLRRRMDTGRVGGSDGGKSAQLDPAESTVLRGLGLSHGVGVSEVKKTNLAQSRPTPSRQPSGLRPIQTLACDQRQIEGGYHAGRVLHNGRDRVHDPCRSEDHTPDGVIAETVLHLQ